MGQLLVILHIPFPRYCAVIIGSASSYRGAAGFHPQGLPCGATSTLQSGLKFRAIDITSSTVWRGMSFTRAQALDRSRIEITIDKHKYLVIVLQCFS